jgi:hypothetical protein
MSKAHFTIIENPNMRILISYQTVVAAYDLHDHTFYRTAKKWSVTTSKHINGFAHDLNISESKVLEQADLEKLVWNYIPSMGDGW